MTSKLTTFGRLVAVGLHVAVLSGAVDTQATGEFRNIEGKKP